MLWKHRNIEARIWPLDHCPPHVTFVCRAEEWTARIQFSMVLDDVSLWDVKPLRNAPSLVRLNTLANQVQRALDVCRVQWWNAHGTVCLDNKAVRRAGPSSVSLRATTGLPGVIVAKSGSYQAKGRALEVRVSVRWDTGVTHQEVVEP